MSVLFGVDALSDSTINALVEYIGLQQKQFVWASNFFLWPPDLTRGAGAVLTHKLSASWAEALFGELRDRRKLPYVPSEGVAMFYAWLGGSHITWHSDYADKSSMTIYLSKNWNPDDGGYFCWRDWDESTPRHSCDRLHVEAKMRLPLYNTFVHITDSEWHTTTLTVPSAPTRFSLQFFFARQ